MKANFHLITESDEEVLLVTQFIESILKKRKERQLTERQLVGAKAVQAAEMMERLHSKQVQPEPSEDDDEVPMSAPVKAHVPRPNVSPGEPAITKIGENAKTTIMSELQTGSIQPHAKYAEHLKLLWKRGEVKWDGKEYYL